MDIDWSVVAFEVLNFGVLLLLLRRFLFRPVQRAIATRRDELERSRRDAEARELAASQAKTEYEHRRRALEGEAGQRLEAAIAEGRAQAEALVEAAREQARRLLAATEQQAVVARRRSLEHLRTEVLGLGAEAAARVVQHMEEPAIACAYARRAAHGFAEIFGDEVPRSVHVEVGQDVDPERVVQELRAILGPEPVLELVVDASIVAGARLRAEGHEVEASVSASLHRWYEEQLGEDGPPREAEA